MKSQGATKIRQGRFVASCSEGFCRGQTASGTSGLERGIFDILNFVIGGGRHDVPLPRDRRMRADMIFALRNGFAFAVEYDGAFWHLKSFQRDIRKSYMLRASVAHEVIRIREQPLEPTTDLDVVVPCKPTAALCARLTLAHLLHTLSLHFDYETVKRIEHALQASGAVLPPGMIGCVDCRKTLRALDADGFESRRRSDH
jgi:hypothetical protein